MDSQPGMSVHYFQLHFLAKLASVEMNAYTHSLSCWHENPSESDAKWALYAQRDAGIAIKSTVHRILNAFSSSKRTLSIAKVTYDSEGRLSAMTSGIYDSLLIKRHAFHHENEVRIIATTYDGYEAPEWTEGNQCYNFNTTTSVLPGVYIDCDIQSLIEEVVVSPLTPLYSYEAMERIVKTLLPSISIRKSQLLFKGDDLPLELFSPELKLLLWDNYRRTRRLLDGDELSLDPLALRAIRLQKIRPQMETAQDPLRGGAA
jgi:hypothetical protein